MRGEGRVVLCSRGVVFWCSCGSCGSSSCALTFEAGMALTFAGTVASVFSLVFTVCCLLRSIKTRDSQFSCSASRSQCISVKVRNRKRRPPPPLFLHCFVSCFPRPMCVQCGSRTYSTVSLRCWWRCESPDPRREEVARREGMRVSPADDENLSPCWHQCEPQAMSTLSSITVICLKAAKERETWHADRTDDDKIHLPPQSEPHRGDARYSASN